MGDGIVYGLQQRYLSGDKRAAAALYSEIRYLSEAAARKKGIDDGRLDELCHEVASRLILRLQRNHGYKIRSFNKSIYYEIRNLLTPKAGPKAEMQSRIVPLEEAPSEDAPVSQKTAVRDYWKSVVDWHPSGKRILVCLAFAPNYKRAILSIRDLAGESWCYGHAVELRHIYRMIHRRG
jgi:hypothetical protein